MGAFKLGKMTFGSLFKKPSTVRYPFETKPQPAGLKGQIGIQTDACILCGMCDRSCTTGAITVSKEERYWQIDRYRCVQCGYCILVCPKQCLAMLPDYASAVTDKVWERFTIPEEGQIGPSDPSLITPPVEPMAAPLESKEAAKRLASLDQTVRQVDQQLMDLIELMGDEEKAARVHDALSRFESEG